MNANFPAIASDLWSLAGWTMVHFLWLGTIVAAFAFAGRLTLRNAAPTTRYAFALMCLALITTMPLAAAWLYEPSPAARAQLAVEPSPSGRGQGEGASPTSTIPASPSSSDTEIPSPTPPIIELHTPSSPALPPSSPVAPPLPALDAQRSTLAPSQPSTSLNSQLSTLNHLALAPRSSPLTALIPYLPWLWLIGTPLTFALLFTGLIGTHRLSRASTPLTAGPIADALARLTAPLRITRRVTVAVCERVAAPVLIGIVRPMILLPPAALTGWSPNEIEMVLLHELAHIRRYDNVVNLAQRIIESLLFFHPAVWLISTWVRREREACCDAAVVTRTQQPHAYATLLFNIATHLSDPAQGDPGRPRNNSDLNNDSEPGRPRPRSFPLGRGRGRPGSLPVSSHMAAGPLRTRIRHILQLEDDPMLITPKSLAITLATLLAAATLAFVYLPRIGQAEQSTTEGTENTKKKQERREAKSTDETTPEPTLIPFRFVLKRDSAGKTQLYMNDQPVGDDVVREVFTRQAKFIDKLQVTLSAEKGVSYADVMKTIDRLESLGIKKLALDTRALEMDNQANVAPSPKENEASGTLDGNDWPRGFAFPSPKEGEISKRAWKLFHVKVVPASDEELQQVLRRGKRGGLKLVEFKEFPHFEEPFILTDIGSKPISRGIVTFDDLAKVLDTLESQPAGNDDIIGLNGEAKNGHFQYNLRLPSSANATASTKFPAIEDQKLADLAWKRLGLELEPIAADDLQRVKALGYDGGVKVVVGQPEGGGFGGGTGGTHGRIQADDLLVGLHVWPTTSLKDIATILNRDDLAELNPLKFYVVRRHGNGEDRHGEKVGPGDTVFAGRINVQLANNAAVSGNRRDNGPASPPTPTRNAPTPWSAVPSTPYQGTPSPPDAGSSTTPPAQPDPYSSLLARRASQLAPQALRYDGKPFDEWRNVWKTELSTEKRIEAVKALAAFGRAGYGPEAAAAILDVAAEYDYNRGGDLDIQLREAINNALMFTVPAKDWMPNLRARYDKAPDKWKPLALSVLSQARDADEADAKQNRNFLLQLSRSSDWSSAALAIGPLVKRYPNAPETTQRLFEVLKDKEHWLSAVEWFTKTAQFPPEVIELILHGDDKQQASIRAVFYRTSNSPAYVKALQTLLEVLKDESKAEDHLAAIRAIGVTRVSDETLQRTRDAALEAIIEKGPLNLRISAAIALQNATGGRTQAISLLRKKLGDLSKLHTTDNELREMHNKELSIQQNNH